MSWNFLISFGVGFAIYMVGLVIWSFIKKHKIKKQIQHDDEVNSHEEDKK